VGTRTKPLLKRDAHPAIVDAGTDEAAVLLRLGNLARTGDLGYDDGREWGELLPTTTTLIGGLHLLPQVLQGVKNGEGRKRLGDLREGHLPGPKAQRRLRPPKRHPRAGARRGEC
jgi:hypothetical protein